MATVVLSAVGQVLGGPVGGAIGAVIGQQIDARIFAPKAREGPRLGDLSVQTSSYGTAIPKIFGRMRVAGTVIWATDLKEHKEKSGGGKGRPKTVSYSYSASFAVALSGRAIRTVRRIWADGKLLRGAGGDFKVETGYRLYRGSEAQAVDPLIASAEGAGGAPAYRGIAYAVFENMQLADFGNRIPSLTFEVEADAEAVAIGAIAEALSGGEVVGGETLALTGYAASGDSVRSAVEALGDVLPLSLVEQEGRLLLRQAPAGAAFEIEAADCGAAAGEGRGDSEVVRGAAATVPSEVSIAYYALERDYQTGLQRAARGGASLRAERRALPAVLTAGAAKGLAEFRLEALWAGRTTAKLRLPLRLAGRRAGDALRVPGQAGVWKVARWRLEDMVVHLELARLPASPLAIAAESSHGRPGENPDLPRGRTKLVLLDLPDFSDEPASRPRIVAAAAGEGAGWRGAVLLASQDGGATWQPAGGTGAPAVIGTALTPLGAAGSAVLDLKNTVEVELIGDAMWLESCSDAALAGGANLAALGREVLQFGAADAVGERRFRLSRLLRGRRGTEWAAVAHAAGEAFVLLRAEDVATLDVPRSAVPGEIRLLGSGAGDVEEAAAAVLPVTGEALRPPSPVHLGAGVAANGDIVLRWTRRSRAGWAWDGQSEAPRGEDREAYRVVLTGEGFERVLTVARPRAVYRKAQQVEDGLTGPLAVAVSQIGTFGDSRPATLIIS